MNKGFIFFLLLLPALIALGHDAYIYYEAPEEGFKISDLGWLWYHYAQESHDYAKAQIGDQEWGQYVYPLLELPSVLAALILSGLILLIIIMFEGLASLGNAARSSIPVGSKKKDKGALGRERGEKKKFQYNRK